MRNISLPFIIILCLAAFSYGQINSSAKIFEIAGNRSLNRPQSVELKAKLLKLSKKEWQIDFNIRNQTSRNIFFATNPRQLYGQYGYYMQADKDDASLLRITASVFLPPIYGAYSDKTRVELKKLTSGEIFKETIPLKFPIKQTEPPYEDFALKVVARKNITPEKIKTIELSIAYFPEERGILDFLTLKRFGWYIRGEDKIFTGINAGKTFLDIQELAEVRIPAAGEN